MRTRRYMPRAAVLPVLTIAVICSAALCTACGAASGSSDPASDWTENGGEYSGEWFYNAFDSRQKAVYDAFRQAAEDPFSQELVPVTDEKGDAAEAAVREIDTVYQGFKYDHPELFWLGQSYSYRLSGSDGDEESADAVAVIPIPESPEELEELELKFDAASNAMFEKAGKYSADEEYAAAVYDLLAEGAEYTGEAMYDESMQLRHTAYGAIVDQKAICDGFALAYQYMLSMRGIPCIVIPGESEGNAHTWNIAEWNGRWHEMDLTWDISAGEEGGRRYYDLTTEEMERDHSREEAGIASLIPVSE